MKNVLWAMLSVLCFSEFSCKKEVSSQPVMNTDAEAANYGKNVMKAFQDYGAKNVTANVEGNFLIVKTDGVPDHKSPYFSPNDAKYEKYNGSNPRYQQNPNLIVSQTLTFRFPLIPKEASAKSATPLGPIGIALNGVPFFNQYAGSNQPLSFEIDSFDQFGGHPQQTGQYHYHLEPYYLTKNKGKDVFLGILLDGFPVYGPIENGKAITNADLDAYHGHFTKNTDFPNGIYHYHITDADPYLNGSGFYGTPGTVTR
jgi:YHYH protein